MKRKRFTEEQIALALRQAESGTPVDELIRDRYKVTSASRNGTRRAHGKSESRQSAWEIRAGRPIFPPTSGHDGGEGGDRRVMRPAAAEPLRRAFGP